MLILLLEPAFADPPADLDALVELAVARDPELRALDLDAQSAGARALAAHRPMDPQVMVEGQAIGAPADAADPPMVMVGATQMLRGFGEGAAQARRIELDATRATVDRDRVTADLRTRLWQGAARVQALEDELRLLDDEVQAANAAGEVALARYGAGAVVSGGMSGMEGGGMPMGGNATPMEGGTAPPLVQPRSGGAGGGMPGMSGMTGRSTGGSVPVPSGGMSMSAGAAPPTAKVSTSSGLPALLALQAEVARVEADRAALQAQLEGELAVVAAFVGTEGADAVRATPSAFYGASTAEVPERRLAEVDVDAAAASLEVARLARRPDFMIAADQRFMPNGMPAGTDVTLGLEVPLWGSRGATIDAARADVGAAEARAERVDRDLAVAAAGARAALAAAQQRSDALETVAVPKAKAAWDAAIALFATGTVGEDQVLRAWQTRIAVERDAVEARRDVQLREADLARVEEP